MIFSCCKSILIRLQAEALIFNKDELLLITGKKLPENAQITTDFFLCYSVHSVATNYAKGALTTFALTGVFRISINISLSSEAYAVDT
jgi:hypothetical protein